MADLKNIEALVNLLDDGDPLKKILSEIHQELCRLSEWIQNIEEEISKET